MSEPTIKLCVVCEKAHNHPNKRTCSPGCTKVSRKMTRQRFNHALDFYAQDRLKIARDKAIAEAKRDHLLPKIY